MNFGVVEENQVLFSKFNYTEKDRADKQMSCLNKLYQPGIKRRSVIFLLEEPKVTAYVLNC